MSRAQRCLILCLVLLCLSASAACSLTFNGEPLQRRCSSDGECEAGQTCAQQRCINAMGAADAGEDPGDEPADDPRDAHDGDAEADEGEGDARDSGGGDADGGVDASVDVGEEVGKECELAGDCAQRSCALAACVETRCQYTLVPAATACDDGDPCTHEDTCQESGACTGKYVQCLAPDPPRCDEADANFITFATPGLCGTDGLCRYEAVTQPCLECAQRCLHACDEVLCPNDGDSCVVSTCAPRTQTCVDTQAADGTACTGPGLDSGVCAQGRCVECIDSTRCEDNNPCTSNVCQGTTCVYPPAVDQEGQPCPTGFCAGGACVQCTENEHCTSPDCLGAFCDVDRTCKLFRRENGVPCPTGFCFAGECSDCGTNDQCGMGERCEGGECVAL